MDPRHAQSHALGSGLVSGNRLLDPARLAINARRAASALHHAGVWQGDAVALLMRNDFTWFEATQGASLLGASTVPLNWHLTSEELAYILDDCDARTVIAHADLLDESVLSVCTGREVIAVETPPEVAAAYGIGASRCHVPGALPEWSRWISAHAEWETPPPCMAQPLFYSSGTTGRPKGVVRRAATPEVAASAGRRTVAAFGIADANVRAVMTGPLYHSAPNSYGMRIAALGGLLVLQPRFDAQELLALIERWQITHLHMVPTMFVRLLALPDAVRHRHDLSSLRFVCHGSAPCPPEIKRQMIDWWGPVIHEYYAMTETGIITISDSTGWLAHPGSVGHAAPGVQLRIVDADGNACPTDTAGEILVSSETTPYFTYHRAEEKTAAAREGDFVRTGDVGSLDADGYLTISDRKSDMVISGGVNIYPAEVEQRLVCLPGVKDCAVFGVPDPEYGERLVAVIEPAAGMPDLEGIRLALRESLASYKVPREFRLVGSLPREDTGKIKKRLLRNEWTDATTS
jgi:long-chain acyl-CoA synthetase